MIKNTIKSVKTNKKGNVSVMLAMLFTCLLMLASVFIFTSAKNSTYSYCDGIFQMAGRSILSEYHLALKDSYGLIAYTGYEGQVDKRLKFYINAGFKRKLPDKLKTPRENITLIRPELENISCRLTEFCLMDVNIFEEQIVEAMKYPQLIKSAKSHKTTPTAVSASGGSKYGVLANKAIISELPSKGLGNNGINIKEIISKGLPTWQELTSTGSNALLTNEYALSKFNYRMESQSNIETFFQNELEYILYGKFSDEENQNKFISEFKIMRVLLNSAHIYSDSEKRKQIIALAEILTPGPEAAITAVALAEIWAYAETLNDAKLLLEKNNVALIKGKDTWALGLGAAVSGMTGGNAVKPKSDKGYSYKDYIRLFLYFENRETKLMRMMDLIQINIRGGFDSDFKIADCYVGLEYRGIVNGQEYRYVQNY